jgi:hypothetical protein
MYQPIPYEKLDKFASEYFIDYLSLSQNMIECLDSQEYDKDNLIRSLLSHFTKVYRPVSDVKRYTNGNISLYLSDGLTMEIKSFTFFKLDFKGSYWTGDVTESIFQLQLDLANIYQSLFDNHFETRSLEIFMEELKIGRIDLSRNWYCYIDLDNVVIRTDPRNKTIHYKDSDKFMRTENGRFLNEWDRVLGELETIVVGGQAKEFKDMIRMVVYDKEKDPRNLHDLRRFDTVKFFRQEYNVGKRRMKDVGISTVYDLDEEHILYLWEKCCSTHRMVFEYDKYTTFEWERKPNVKVKKAKYDPIPQIVGLLKMCFPEDLQTVYVALHTILSTRDHVDKLKALDNLLENRNLHGAKAVDSDQRFELANQFFNTAMKNTPIPMDFEDLKKLVLEIQAYGVTEDDRQNQN